MIRVLASALLAVLVTLPVEAAGPVALLAKQMVQDYVQSQLTSFVSGSGAACKPMGLAGALPGLPAMGAAPAMPSQISQLMPSPSSLPSSPQFQNMDAATRAQIMQMMAGMQSAPPLTAPEIDELVNRFAALSKAFPEQALPCSPDEMKAVFGSTAAGPMVSGPMRMMLEQFRAMEQNAKEVEARFASMSSAERAEAMDAILSEAGTLNAEERQQFVAVLNSDLTGIPAPVRAELRARLSAR